MEVTVQDIEEGLDPRYEVQDIGDDGYRVSNDNGDAGVVSFGIDDGNAYMDVDSWTGVDDRIYEDDSESDSFMDARVLDNVLMDEEIEDLGNRVRSILSNGMSHAYNLSNKEEQADTLLTSAHRAYNVLESRGKGIGRVSLDAEGEGPLGNAVLHYGEAPDNDQKMGPGINDVKIDMEEYENDRGFATSATYIMGAVLLNESNSDKKPQVSTEMGYKRGSKHHESQETKADMELVEEATDISKYDFLN
ncbi:MAG: hypothetical protein ABEJ87_01365 [Candidatus Nanohalobium sp.]